MQTFRDIEEEVKFFRHTQVSKYTHIYSITLPVATPNQNVAGSIQTEAVLQIMEDADFHITHLSGCVQSPTDSNGVRQFDWGTDMSIKFAMAGSPNRSDRGISFKFVDTKTNRSLTRAQITRNAVDLAVMVLNPWDHTYLNFGDVFTPGYDYGWGKPVGFKYTLLRGERIKVLLQNTDTNNNGLTDSCQYVSMAFIGNRYDT